ncbi:MAG: hypothetical protein IPM82_10880 [Saprospiraceae bacterium]|nr:hypothetical protein [Saprospiraceae bacterium]
MLLQLMVTAQDTSIGQLFISNDKSGNAILLKWVIPEFGAEEGFQVYRQKDGESAWALLNTDPIKKMPTLQLNPNDRDDAINFLEDYIKNNDLSKADPFTLLLLSRKLVEVNDFAQYLGLFHQDETVQNDQPYRYKVTKLAREKSSWWGFLRRLLPSLLNPLPHLKASKYWWMKKWIRW